MSRYDDDDPTDEEYTPSDSSDDTSSAPEEEQDPSLVKAARRVTRGGWSNAKQQKAASSPFPQNLKPEKDGLVVKFLEDGPYTTYRQHWIQEIQEGTKAFTCLDGVDPKGCPLCDGGNRPSTQFRFNVALITSDAPAALHTYNIGPTVFDQLSELHTDPPARDHWRSTTG